MTRQIFRKEALDRLASPEQLDQLMQLTSPRGWIALAGVGLLLLTALVWGLCGTVATTVEGQGFLLPAGGLTSVGAPHTGVITGVYVEVGQTIAKDQKLVDLNPAAAPVSPFPARVLAVAVKKGDSVEQGAVLLTLEPLQEPLQAILFVPASEGYQVATDKQLPVEVWPASVKRGEYGGLVGYVKSAAKFPCGRAEILRRVQSEDLVNSLSGTGPFLEVVVDLERDPSRPDGYHWSASRGPDLPLYGGTPCQGQITVSRQRPISLVFPLLRYQGGS
jgi:hypothetical protein